MSDANILKEFLVSVGFKVDDQGFKSLQKNLTEITKWAAGAVAAVEAAAVSISLSVNSIAKSFDSLYFASQRTGASVDNIKSLSYAFSQLGASSQSTVSAIESFSRKIRTDPGMESLLQTFGVKTREKSGELRDPTKLISEFANSKRLSSMRYGLQLDFANQFGLTDDVFLAARSGKAEQYLEEYRRKTKAVGLDNDRASKTFSSLQRAMTSLWGTIGVVAEKVGEELSPSIEEMAKNLDKWLLENSGKIVPWLKEFGKALLELAKQIGELMANLTPAITKFNEWAKSFDENSELVTAMKWFAGFVAGAWLARLLLGFGAAGRGFLGLLATLGLINPVTGAAVTMGVAGAIAGSQNMPMVDEFGRETGNWGGKTATTPLHEQKSPIGRAVDWVKRKLGFGGTDASAGEGFFGAIMRAEGTAGHKDVATPFDVSLANRKSPKPLTQMTMAEALDWGEEIARQEMARTGLPRGRVSSAKGAFQIVNSTQKDAMAALGLTGDDMFSPENQRKMALWIAKTQGLGAWEGLKNNPIEMGHAYAALRAGSGRAQSGSVSPSGSGGLLPHSPLFPAMTGVNPMLGRTPSFMQPNAGLLLPSITNGGDTKIEINQSNTTTVHGATDPSAAADAVGGTISRNNAGLFRQFSTAVR